MLKQQKFEIVDKLTSSLSKSNLILLTDYKGMNVETISKLRRELSKVNAEYTVVKNTLLKISLKNMGIYVDSIDDHLQGTTAILYTSGDPVLALKGFYKFLDENGNIPVVKSGFFEKKFITAEQAKEFSNLPPKEVLLAQLVGQIQAPIYSLHAVLSGTLRKLLYVLDGIREKKS
ncbi:50S ribosomal protein L10 [Athalassotoga saccharophila]|uniref:50S ribosomal protein L10 n=1 Tax=Athalassotoga saccharophila TaxID=1441386 RepID=UPI00137A3458|nr:50S ribosomal protein L10 [Athalassotoga saccharophila]BBJ27717.1 50S ribosomal protein L10 [Athalassotoga saccharophila]